VLDELKELDEARGEEVFVDSASDALQITQRQFSHQRQFSQGQIFLALLHIALHCLFSSSECYNLEALIRAKRYHQSGARPDLNTRRPQTGAPMPRETKDGDPSRRARRVVSTGAMVEDAA
jgi:hypothetical protein